VDAPGGIGAIILLGALALCVAAIAGLVLSNNVVKDRKAQLAQITAQNAATVAKANTLKPYSDFQTLAQDRLGTVQALASARFDWEQSLRDLSRAMPKEVYLSSLDGSVGGGAGGGSSLRGSISSPAIELKGCTKSQPAVADLMSQLRNVEGVTRVSLANSDKDVGASAGAGTVNPCGKGNPATFDVVIFFERSAVAQALAGATGAVDPAAAAAAPSTDPKATATADPAKSGSQPAATPSTPPAAAITGGTK
jgi:Tfp pilus assembly protein PilN